ncbi:hypothetical protein DPMN_094083 [Dreissena polymorpha]|uniref:Uncharacterized protein n=1 Tax=Dreissena polymorpha TaxID=45954 RepID=A0A9D4L4T8_DREPO|nr:hypothetical protein DPMN_094083 [Dreissena polymorpha]
MNLLTKFHEDRTINVASRVLTRFYYSRIRNKSSDTKSVTDRQTDSAKTIYPLFFERGHKNAPPLGSHVFQANIIIFELLQDIIETNLLTKFHEDWTINVASRVLTR